MPSLSISNTVSQTTVKQNIFCMKCGGSRQIVKRLPNGWKRKDDALFCGPCWKSKFVLRAVIVPVTEPLDITWEDLRLILRKMFEQTTSLSNWMTSQLALLDVKRIPQESKLPP